jgi:hypothetical protein
MQHLLEHYSVRPCFHRNTVREAEDISPCTKFLVRWATHWPGALVWGDASRKSQHATCWGQHRHISSSYNERLVVIPKVYAYVIAGPAEYCTAPI